MERTWNPEEFQYNTNTASWQLKEELQLADVVIKCSISSAVFPNGTVDWTIVNEFMTFLQKRQAQIGEDMRWVIRIINATAESNAEVPPPEHNLQLAGITLRRYKENGYSFSYDYLLSAIIAGKALYWTARLKNYSIAGVVEGEIYI